jgi:ABC-type multidrug transport system fused ATPase/permease subunit
MDEATSNVDHDADAKITETLKTALPPGTTVITIAHRLRTVIDPYDHSRLSPLYRMLIL